MNIKHAFVSSKPDDADATLVRPSAWNQAHTFELPVSLGAFVTLTNVGAAYDTITAARGLGFVELDMTGVTAIDFTVQVSKIGTGTQSWQLWNETDSAQVGVIDDAGAAGNKTLTATLSGLALTGVKRLRVRAKSTIAADDPLYYGSALRVKRP
jgi:hypothetical protein